MRRKRSDQDTFNFEAEAPLASEDFSENTDLLFLLAVLIWFAIALVGILLLLVMLYDFFFVGTQTVRIIVLLGITINAFLFVFRSLR